MILTKIVEEQKNISAQVYFGYTFFSSSKYGIHKPTSQQNSQSGIFKLM